MSKILVFSDLHIHNYRQFNVNNSRLKNCLNAVRMIFRFAKKNGITTVLMCGDLFDTQQTLHTSVVNETVAMFKKLFKEHPDVVMYCISGNHDHATKNMIDRPAETALTYLSILFKKNFVLLDNATAELDDLVVHGIPYYEDPEQYRKALQMADERRKAAKINAHQILMIHQTPEGIMDGFIPTDTSIHDELYNDFDLVLCGHIHVSQVIEGKLVVVGSTIHRDKGDIGQEKGFWIFDRDQLRSKFISMNSKFPCFMPEDDPNAKESDFIIPASIGADVFDVTPDQSKFTVSNTPVELITAYWEQTDGKNKELLKTGLGLI